MKPINKHLEATSKTFETRLLTAVWNDDNSTLNKMIVEAENLYKEGYLTETEFNTMTDLELIKQIYS